MLEAIVRMITRPDAPRDANAVASIKLLTIEVIKLKSILLCYIHYHRIILHTVQKIEVLCSPILYLIDQKHSKNKEIVK